MEELKLSKENMEGTIFTFNIASQSGIDVTRKRINLEVSYNKKGNTITKYNVYIGDSMFIVNKLGDAIEIFNNTEE